MRYFSIVLSLVLLFPNSIEATQKVDMAVGTRYTLVPAFTEGEACKSYFRLSLVNGERRVSFLYLSPGFPKPKPEETVASKVRFIQTTDVGSPEVWLETQTLFFVIRATKEVIEKGMNCSDFTPVYEEARSSN